MWSSLSVKTRLEARPYGFDNPMPDWIKKLLGITSKEERYISNVEKELRELHSDALRLQHSKALIEARIAGIDCSIKALEECLPLMRHSLEKRVSVVADRASEL